MSQCAYLMLNKKRYLLTYLPEGETSRGELTKGRNVPKSRCGLRYW